MATYQLEIKSVYDFALKAGAIIGYTFKSATVMGLLDFESANAIEDVTPIHAAVYSQLGAGVPRNPRDLTYVKLKTSTGETRVIAMDWIASQPVLVTSQTVQAIISEMNLSDIERLRQVLITNGFTKVVLTVLDEPA